MAVKMEHDQSLFVAPPNDPYLIGVARDVNEGLARDHVTPGQLLRAVERLMLRKSMIVKWVLKFNVFCKIKCKRQNNTDTDEQKRRKTRLLDYSCIYIYTYKRNHFIN